MPLADFPGPRISSSRFHASHDSAGSSVSRWQRSLRSQADQGTGGTCPRSRRTAREESSANWSWATSMPSSPPKRYRSASYGEMVQGPSSDNADRAAAPTASPRPGASMRIRTPGCLRTNHQRPMRVPGRLSLPLDLSSSAIVATERAIIVADAPGAATSICTQSSSLRRRLSSLPSRLSVMSATMRSPARQRTRGQGRPVRRRWAGVPR